MSPKSEMKKRTGIKRKIVKGIIVERKLNLSGYICGITYLLLVVDGLV